MKKGSFLKTFLLSAGLLIPSIAGFNLLMDPYYFFGTPKITRVNDYKHFTDSGGRRLKATTLDKSQYDNIILGTSRAQGGLNANHLGFEGKTYNVGLPATNMIEIYDIYQFSKESSTLDSIVLSVDLLAFTEDITHNGDFYLSDFSDEKTKPLLANIESLLSVKTLKFSAIHLLKNIFDLPESGYTPTGEFISNKTVFNHRKSFNRVLLNNFFGDSNIYSTFSYSQERVELVREIIQDCKRNNIKVHIFISPIHARQMAAIEVAGLYPTFEKWKRDLTAVIDEENSISNPLTLWDFAFYNDITTEAVPLAKEPQQMKYWKDSSHYRQRLGEQILSIVLNNNRKGQNIGVALTPKNIDKHLSNNQKERNSYASEFPFEVQEVKRLFDESTENHTVISLNESN